MCGRNTPAAVAPMIAKATDAGLSDRKQAAEDATGFKLKETVATFQGIKVVVGFGRVNIPGSSEPARVLLLSDLSQLSREGVNAVTVASPNDVHKLAEKK